MSDLLWVEGDDADIVYHRPSGRTHCVNAATTYLLLDVLKEPKHLNAVIHDLKTGRGIDSQDLSPEYVTGLLLRLEELGLVQRL